MKNLVCTFTAVLAIAFAITACDNSNGDFDIIDVAPRTASGTRALDGANIPVAEVVAYLVNLDTINGSYSFEKQ